MTDIQPQPESDPPPQAPPAEAGPFRDWLQLLLRSAGFTHSGVAPARLHGPDGQNLHEWLKRGYHGSMGYMAQGPDRRHDARYLLPGARSVIMLAAAYDPPPVQIPPRDSRRGVHSDPEYGGGPIANTPDWPPPQGQVRIAAYATGEDYHLVLKEKARDHLLPVLQAAWPGEQFRCVTDSAPLLERAFARRAGLGFIGKNTLHIIPGSGSFHFLAAIVTTAELPRTPPVRPMPHCGNCTRCLDACPTQAFVGPFVLDARRCISYLTIEKRDALSEQEQSNLQGMAFGCDICQQVCPYNKSPEPISLEEFREGRIVGRLEPVSTFLSIASRKQFEKRFARSPLLRAGAKRLLPRVSWMADHPSGMDLP